MTAQSETPEVVHNLAEERFEVAEGEELAFLSYGMLNERLVLLHADVPESLKGRGVASMLVACWCAARSSARCSPPAPWWKKAPWCRIP